MSETEYCEVESASDCVGAFREYALLAFVEVRKDWLEPNGGDPLFVLRVEDEAERWLS